MTLHPNTFGQIKRPHDQTIFFVVKEAEITGNRHSRALPLPALSVVSLLFLKTNRDFHLSECCYLMMLCCITTTDTGIVVLPSGAAMLYYIARSLNAIAAIWCRYVVLQRPKRGEECCHLVPVYCITTIETCASRHRNKAHTMRFDFTQFCCLEFILPGILRRRRLLKYIKPKLRKIVVL